ncbi:MAG: heparinase II/III domain-containing protein, partial [Armatimonadota bacterium]
ERAVEWLMELSEWDVRGTTGYRNHDQVFRDIAWKAACVYDWCYDVMTDEERAKALGMIEARGGILFTDFSEDSRPIYEYPFDSHGWTSMGFLGIIASATAHDSPQADEWLQFIGATYPALYPPWGGEEGGWCQGTAYWKWSVHFFAEFADAFASATGVDLFDKAFMRNNGWFKPYMHPPFCDRHHFGDGNLGSPGGADRNNQLNYATRYDNPYFKWYADQIHGSEDTGVFGYWWYDYDMPARPPIDQPQSKYLSDIGWVGMHSDMTDPDDVMLIFKSSWYGSFNHSHADQNHFVINAYGEPLLIDSGYYDWYNSDHDRNWTRQTKAHNSILVNGEGQPIFDISAKGEIVDYLESPVGVYTAGDATEAYQGKLSKFVRHILYLRPDAFVIVDELEAPEASTWTWAAHALDEMAVDEQGRRVTVTQGDAALDIAFATPDALTFTQDDDWDGHDPQGRYAEQPKNWHLYAETPEASQSQRFVTLMRAREGGEQPTFDSGTPDAGNGVRAELGRLLAAVRDGDEPLTIGDSTVDAEIAAAYMEDAGAKMVAVGCREVSVDGAPAKFFTSTEPATVALEWDGLTFLRGDVRTSADTEVAIWIPQGIEGLTLDDEPLTADRCEVNAQTGVVTIALPAGMHSLTSPVARPVAEGSFDLTIDGDAPADLDQEVLPAYTGSGLLFANFSADEGLYRVAPGGAPEAPAMLNGSSLDDTGGLIWLRDGNTLEARLTQPTTVNLKLDRLPLDSDPHVAQVLEDAPEGMKIEAETFTEEGLGQASRYAHRTFLSGGVGVGEWLVPGMWLGWDLDAPAGDYHLVLKGATHEARADRLIMLNGEPVGGAWQVFRFEHTGGYGSKPEEWAHMMVMGADGGPLTLTLEDGAQSLRMVYIENRLNLDYLVLVPAE